MNKNLQSKLKKISETFDDIQKKLSSPNITNEERIELSKKFSSLEQIIIKKNELKKIEKSLSDTKEILNEEQDNELARISQRRYRKS